MESTNESLLDILYLERIGHLEHEFDDNEKRKECHDLFVDFLNTINLNEQVREQIISKFEEVEEKLAIVNVDCNKYVYKGAFCDGQKYQLELCEYDILKKQVENISRRDFIDELFTLKNEEISRFTEKEQEMLNEKKVDVNIEYYITDKSEKNLKEIEDYVDAVYTNYSIEEEYLKRKTYGIAIQDLILLKYLPMQALQNQKINLRG